MTNFFKFLFLIAVAIITISCKDEKNGDIQPNAYSKNTIQYKSVNGIDANLLSLDIYHFGQTTQLAPVVIYIHGGGFAVGDKANNMTNKQNLFSSLGYILVSVNYRLSPEVYSTDPNRVMYPIHHNDVSDAIKWVYENINKYGGNNQKIALLGHSAGAQLVALIGTSKNFLPNRKMNLDLIKGVACIDTEGYDVLARCNENNQVYLNAFGQKNTFWFEASPINNLFSGIAYPKFFIAKRGTNTRIGYSNDFITKLQGFYISVSEVTANQYDHEGINDAIGAVGESTITKPLIDFFFQCFR